VTLTPIPDKPGFFTDAHDKMHYIPPLPPSDPARIDPFPDLRATAPWPWPRSNDKGLAS
jgi:hypothetical protein